MLTVAELDQQMPNEPDGQPLAIFIFSILALIPVASVFGNLLVFISVLRFKALHSTINFHILGLAFADLMVALFVMPFAVYIYTHGGYWPLAAQMCNLYLSLDVAFSTASIIFLALISFDRYKAVSQPIQYSRESKNKGAMIRRFLCVWIYAFAVALPLVLGFNQSPSLDTPSFPYTCRFYDANYQIFSSSVSFILPGCLIIFPCIRTIRALQARERGSQLRRLAGPLAKQNNNNCCKAECDAAEIVSRPAFNLIMIALPSLSQHMKRYERHKSLLEEIEIDEKQSSGCSASSESNSLNEDFRIQSMDFLSEIAISAPMNPIDNGTTLHVQSFLIGPLKRKFSKRKNKRTTKSRVVQMKQQKNWMAPANGLMLYGAKEADGATEGTVAHQPIRPVHSLPPTLGRAQWRGDIGVRNNWMNGKNFKQLHQNVEVKIEMDGQNCAILQSKKLSSEIAAFSTSFKMDKTTTASSSPRPPLRRSSSAMEMGGGKQKISNKITSSIIETNNEGANNEKDKTSILRRKVAKTQRKERRATKTLGIVVGTFLCCWLPFATLYTLNGLCLAFGAQWCQIEFGPFFVTTWIGYLNSLLNPIIYTIFNPDFRRAFKCLLLRRKASTRFRQRL